MLFPLGLALAWAGVLHWLLHAVGVLEQYRSVFHAVAQVQGFMTAFAVGFLFTFVHRRSGTAPPSAAEMALAVAAPVVSTAAAWAEAWSVAEGAWLALVAVVLAHALRRLASPSARGRFPATFAWAPVGLAAGAGGAVLVALAHREGAPGWALDLGRGLLAQAMVTGLVLGVGGVLIPQLTRGEPPPAPARRGAAGALLQVVAALVFAGSLGLDVAGWPRAGPALRGAVAALVLARSHRALRRPTLPGLHRRLVWIAAWLLPAGYLLAAAAPGVQRAGLHVVFVGGYALIALAVSTHVVLSHGGQPARLDGSPPAARALAALLAVAVVARALVDVDPARFALWLGVASAAFLAATLAWLALVKPALVPGRGRAGAAPATPRRA